MTNLISKTNWKVKEVESFRIETYLTANAGSSGILYYTKVKPRASRSVKNQSRATSVADSAEIYDQTSTICAAGKTKPRAIACADVAVNLRTLLSTKEVMLYANSHIFWDIRTIKIDVAG